MNGRDKTHVTRAEVLAILDRLPERSRAGHPVKAFVTLAAELGIRRETMDKLEVPKHCEPGDDFVPEFAADTAGFEPATSPSGGDGTTSATQEYTAFSRAKRITRSPARRS